MPQEMYYYNIKNISVYSIIDQFEWGVHNIPGTVLDAGDIVVSKKDKKIPASMELTL